MRYFIVYAHPEPRSLNGSLKDAAVQALTQAGHVRTCSGFQLHLDDKAGAGVIP